MCLLFLFNSHCSLIFTLLPVGLFGDCGYWVGSASNWAKIDEADGSKVNGTGLGSLRSGPGDIS